MRCEFTLESWRDGAWYVGRLLEVPGVFSQGAAVEELRENIQEAYDLMVTQERPAAPADSERQDVELEVGSATSLNQPSISAGFSRPASATSFSWWRCSKDK